MDEEWQKLESKNLFDYSRVMNKWDCKQEAKDKGITRHFGRVKELFPISVGRTMLSLIT